MFTIPVTINSQLESLLLNKHTILTFQYLLELIGTFFFAVSGALAMQDKDQDWFSACFTGFITAIGGGSLRDILLGSYPLVLVKDINFLY